jgi:isopenicillin N synthase-like dioxygenase
MARRRWRGSAADRRRRDYRKIFSIGPFDLPDDTYYTGPAAYPSFAPNLWPSRPPELQPAMRAYWQPTGDAFVVNVGDILMRWTNDCWVSTPHRVANPPDGCERRLSIPYFFQANYDTVVERLRQGETPKYPSVTVGAYRAERFAKTAG